MDPLLEVHGLRAGYGQRPAIDGVSLIVNPGEVVVMIGHNGAGKTTSLRCIFGLLDVWAGDVRYKSEQITGRTVVENVRHGIAYMPQEGALFPQLSVTENLEMAGFILGPSTGINDRIASVHSLFPILEERAEQKAGTLSGGEQRMLSFGMALIPQPTLILLDEPSLGLAPQIARRLFESVDAVREAMNVSFLIVEQNVKQGLNVSDRAYVMKTGRVVLEEDSRVLLERGEWWDLF